MNKKIASEFAIGIILLISIIIGGIFWVSKQKQSVIDSQSTVVLKKQLPVKEVKQAENACESHYYEGESKIRGWISSVDKNDGASVVFQVKKEDIKNLPIKNAEIATNFTVRLIDPTSQVKNSLNLATEEKPATITVKGYAEICQQEPPQVSLKEATIAFKKS